MALQIDKTVKIYGDIDVSSLYVRFKMDYDIQGNEVHTFSKVYPSRQAYDNDPNMQGIEIQGIPYIMAINYDRSVDGTDILTVIHDKYKDFLSTDVYEDVPVLDPSTGDYTYDPSTGEIITESILTIPKFANDSSISIVDVD